MAGTHRESELTSIDCPRCHRGLPPGEIAACTHDCGVWVTAATAVNAFLPAELTKSHATKWTRERAPCPHCATLMTLRGVDAALFQGCEEHGFWVDAETVDRTGLVRPTIRALVYAARDTARALRVERERRDARDLEEQAEARAVAAEYRARQIREGSSELEATERAREEEERRREAERASKRKPYVELLQSLASSSDVVPLAEHLLVLDETIDTLWKRIAELERRR